MKQLFIRILFFALVILTSIYLYYSNADGTTDPFYNRFTSRSQTSLIIGTSRAAQGINPDVLNKILKRKDIYNYAFTLGHSPYGEIYFRSIKKKIKEDTRDGVFIVTVDPWSISVNISDENYFHEKERFLNKMYFVNQSPNLNYLLFSYNEKNINIIKNKKKSKTYLDDKGWLQVNIKWDSLTMGRRLNEKIFEYKKNSAQLTVSKYRLKWLIGTINYLKLRGKVFIVRLPIHPKLFDLESKYITSFDNTIREVISLSDGYYDMTSQNKQFMYNDGNHLNKMSVKDVSTNIGNWINLNMK